MAKKRQPRPPERPPKQKKPIEFQAEGELAEQVTTAAAAVHMSVSDYCRLALVRLMQADAAAAGGAGPSTA